MLRNRQSVGDACSGEPITKSHFQRPAGSLRQLLQANPERVQQFGTVVVAELEQVDATWSQWIGDDDSDELLDALRVCLQQLTERARWALGRTVPGSTLVAISILPSVRSISTSKVYRITYLLSKQTKKFPPYINHHREKLHQ